MFTINILTISELLHGPLKQLYSIAVFGEGGGGLNCI